MNDLFEAAGAVVGAIYMGTMAFSLIAMVFVLLTGGF